jgi:hypothetical protein
MSGEPQLAARLFAESLTVAEEIGDGRTVMGTVAGLAGLALALGQPARAVRLLGAAAAAQEASGIRRIAHAAHTARLTTELRIQLAEQAFTAAWNEGYALPFAEAVAEARAIVDSGGHSRLPAAPPRRHGPSVARAPSPQRSPESLETGSANGPAW